MPGVWHPQILADQLTLSQPWEDRLCPPNNTGIPGISDLPTALLSIYAREQERKKMPHVTGFSKGFSQFSSKTKGGPHSEPLENNGPVTRIALAAQTTIIITFWPHVCWCRQPATQ